MLQLNEPALSEFNDFFINTPELKIISGHLSYFNPIKIMGISKNELRHSAILAWLLNPQENHGLGDEFLKLFLTSSMQLEAKDRDEHFPLILSQNSLIATEVRTEWNNIDILLINREHGWVIIIENKLYSKQHSEQLQKYYNIINNEFAEVDELKTHGIFLTLYEEEPEDERYSTYYHGDIIDLLDGLLNNLNRPLSKEVSIFIHHYLEVLHEETGFDKRAQEISKLARSLYRDHKNVIDHLYILKKEHLNNKELTQLSKIALQLYQNNQKLIDFIKNNGTNNDFSLAIENLVGEETAEKDIFEFEGDSYVFHYSSNRLFSFLPYSWYEAWGEGEYPWHGCEKWWLGMPVICWFELIQKQNASPQIRLFAEVGKLEEYEFRKKLIEAIASEAKKNKLELVSFHASATNEGERTSKFFRNNTIKIKDTNDPNEIENAFKDLFVKFNPVFDGLTPVMGNFDEYKKHP